MAVKVGKYESMPSTINDSQSSSLSSTPNIISSHPSQSLPRSNQTEDLGHLRSEIESLSSRCARLEAQNIIAASQQLYLLSRFLSFVLVSTFWFGYVLISWRSFHLAFSWITLQQNYESNYCGLMMLLRFLLLLSKYLSPCLPYIHHKLFSHGLLFRRIEIFSVFTLMMIRIKLVRHRVHLFASKDETLEDSIWEANYEINARFLYASILRLKGIWTKTAQYMSSRADFMPKAYVQELGKLQDEAPETEWEILFEMLKQQYGIKLQQEFEDIEETPMASASIGQVHVAKLKNGEKVVMKIQHPFARRLLLDDFWSLKVMTKIIGILEPEYGFIEALMREWAVEAKKELEFTSELKNLHAARRAVQMMGSELRTSPSTDHSAMPFRVEIPWPYEDLSSNDVLVMSFCEGTRVDDLKQLREWNIPPHAVLNAISQTFAHMMYVTNVFNGDPHPGNILIRPDEENKAGFVVVLLDWGLAKYLPESKRIAFCQMVYAASTMDFGMMLDSFKRVGLKMKREDVAEDMEGVRFLLRDMAPREKARRRIKAKIKTNKARSIQRERGSRVPVESKAYPGEFFFFVRANELLHGLGSKLSVDMSYLNVLKPYAERSLSNYFSNLDKSEKDFTKEHDNFKQPLDEALYRSILQILNKSEQENTIAGAQVCILNAKGNIVANAVVGHMGGLKRNSKMRSDAVLLGFSTTKAIAATLAHVMVEQGYLAYDEPLCQRVWTKFCPQEKAPENLIQTFENAEERWRWKRMVTLRHVLMHTSGFCDAVPNKLSIKTLASCEACCEAFEYNENRVEETILPTSKPGEVCAYHFMSFGWLVAGALRGAYSLRTGKKNVTFEEVYEMVLMPRLSAETLKAGFRPCGGSGNHPLAFTDTDFDFSRVAQLRREAEAMGESFKEEEREVDEVEDEDEDGSRRNQMKSMMKNFRGKEFLFDPRIWNSEEAQDANVPAAGGRFSAEGLAKFYHELGSGKIIHKNTLKLATEHAIHENGSKIMQGETSMSSDDSTGEETSFGLGYQRIRMEGKSDTKAFGHAGVGGSIGFFHEESGVSVGLMLNKVGSGKDVSKKVVRTIAKHFGW